MQGTLMATMLQYIVGVPFSVVVSTCHTVSIVHLKCFIPKFRNSSMIVTLANESYLHILWISSYLLPFCNSKHQVYIYFSMLIQYFGMKLFIFLFSVFFFSSRKCEPTVFWGECRTKQVHSPRLQTFRFDCLRYVTFPLGAIVLLKG